MAFELWSCVIHGEATAARDGFAMVVLHGGSSILLRLASVGELAYLFEVLLGTAMAVLAAVGLVRSFGPNALCHSPALIDEQRKSLCNKPQEPIERPSEQDGEVTVRLEDRHLWPFARHRCIVTVHTALRGVEVGGREVWNARGEN
jgi:hypothetical protein